MLDDVLRYGFNKRIVRDRLHENRSVVVLRRGRHVDLQAERTAFLQQPVVNIFDRFEPRQTLVVNVMRLVVQDHKLVDVPHNHAQVYFRVGRRARWTFAQKVIHGVVVVG